MLAEVHVQLNIDGQFETGIGIDHDILMASKAYVEAHAKYAFKPPYCSITGGN